MQRNDLLMLCAVGAVLLAGFVTFDSAPPLAANPYDSRAPCVMGFSCEADLAPPVVAEPFNDEPTVWTFAEPITWDSLRVDSVQLYGCALVTAEREGDKFSRVVVDVDCVRASYPDVPVEVRGF